MLSEHERSFPLGSNNTSGQSHLGRDAALAGGAGAAGLSAHEARQHHEPTGTGNQYGSQSTTNPLGGSSNTSGQSHLGRDAALAGGAGAAGLGAHEARHHDGSHSTMNPLGGHEHQGHGHNFNGDPCPPGQEHQVPGVHHTSGPHSIDLANRLDPHVPGEFPSDSGLDIHPLATSGTSGLNTHHGHDAHQGHHGAPLAGAAGTAALGAHQHEKNHREAPFAGTSGYDDQRFDPSATHGQSSSTTNPIGTTEHHRGGPTATDPASKTTGPHKSNVLNTLDPRVLPEPEKMKDRNTSGPHNSDTYNKLDPKVDSNRRDEPTQHHYGRDAAVAGGAGAAGVGAYEGSRHAGHNQQDPSGLSTGPYSQTTVGPHSSNLRNEVDPRVDSDLSKTNQGHHYGRDAALAGGAGTAGVGAYEASRHTGHTGHNQQDPSALSTGRHSDPRAESDLSNTTQGHHYGRDAAVAGGVGAAGLGGYEATKKDHLGAPQHQQPLATPTGAPQDARIFDQTHAVPDQKQAGAGWAADDKAQQKLEKERVKEAEKAHDKALKHDKHDAKAAEKAHEKALKHDNKEAEKVHDKDEKKHGILGFLHRDKSPKDTAEERELKQGGNLREADQAAHARHQRELESAAAAGTIGVAGASFEPSVHDQQQYSDPSSSQRLGTDERGHNVLHKEPPAKVQRELDERSREQGGVGGTSTGSGIGNDGIVTEPHTGLPMNVGKYGTGHGGTDGSSNITGYHQH